MDTQSSTIIDQISQNPFLLAHIFKFLTCQELLKLAKICENFHDLIVNHIWKLKYENLHILEFMSKYIISNVTPNEILLEKDYKEFLQLNVNNIKQLKISTFSMLNKCSITFQLNLEFSNLSELSVRDVKFMADDIKCITRNFPYLRKFDIKNCFRANGAAIHTMKDLDNDIFERLMHLEVLKIEHTFQNVYYRKQL
ncbi:hypothetical protein FF38_01083 [Lucilia cuprina]|uniref:F-box domain-containing protein n=1 Tax=Lucilia cuprina TaxID=7375 RepID=A0A0L0CEV7_LUCCU|nr:hypothetical protein FF38_01083 [Lucilia cuprina]